MSDVLKFKIIYRSTYFRPRFLHIVDLCSKILQRILKVFLYLLCLAESWAKPGKSKPKLIFKQNMMKWQRMSQAVKHISINSAHVWLLSSLAFSRRSFGKTEGKRTRHDSSGGVKKKKKKRKKGFVLSVSLSLPLIGCPWLTKSGIFVDSHVKELT